MLSFKSKMGKRSYCALAFMCLAGLVGLADQLEPVSAIPSAELESLVSHVDPNKQTLSPIQKGIDYTSDKEYKDRFAAACNDGHKAVDRALEENKNKSGAEKASLAIVSDLDETLLDNRPFFETIKGQNEDQIDWGAFENWQKTCQSQPLKPTKELLEYARSRGVAIFFVTGRMERLRRVTIENLLKHGIAYDGLYMRANGNEQNASSMKSAYRKQIEDMGFKIVVNIGDQYSDLAGGYSTDCEKLPNKIYYIR